MQTRSSCKMCIFLKTASKPLLGIKVAKPKQQGSVKRNPRHSTEQWDLSGAWGNCRRSGNAKHVKAKAMKVDGTLQQRKKHTEHVRPRRPIFGEKGERSRCDKLKEDDFILSTLVLVLQVANCSIGFTICKPISMTPC